jgi:bacillithiol biosynthesis deacetylase BshB1
MIDVLAIFAHPDDMELSVGGTLLKLKSFGLRTGTLDVTRGEMGTRGTPEVRAKEAEDAAKILKLDVRENLGLPDGNVWLNDENRVKLVRVLRRLKPKVIFTHQLGDPHPDHEHIVNLVRECSRLASLIKYDKEFGQERISAPIVAHSVYSRLLVPSFIVDISQFAQGKMDAIKAHKSQFYNPESNELETMFTSKRLFDEIEAKMTYFGSLINVEAGEPFYVREALNVENPFELLTRPMNLYS